ncbi:IgGFc-binding protein isoform X2 [Entelurus aequoreus]|uniref:IgGFc-binding protein isoform X2 n=1 Tax=Entelurus aequoreus TaxID=161455 RepID=UPI002B1E8B6D|nr:IgGFc-binding protein isoform X2 [Entelurus aequoreus]
MMLFVLLLQVCLVGISLSVASPGWNFFMRFPPHNDPTANASHQVTITATGIRTSVTVKVLQSNFKQHIVLSASQSEIIHLPLSVGGASARSSSLLSVTSLQYVRVLATFCTHTGCEHSLLHDVSSWGTLYYPVTPNFPNQTGVSEVVVTNSGRETSVDIFLSGEVSFNGDSYAKGSVLQLHLGVFESIYLQSNVSLAGSKLYSQEPVGCIVGFTCFEHTVGNCLYGFAELKPVSRWSFEYFVPRVVNAGLNSSLLLAMTKIDADLDVITTSGKKNFSLSGGVMKTIPVVTSDHVYVESNVPLQLIYFRHDIKQYASTLTALLSVDDICHTGAMFDSEDINSRMDNFSHTNHIKSVKLPPVHTFALLPNNESSSTYVDVGHFLNTLNKESYPSVCEKNASSCEDLHCGHKQKCFIKNGLPSCYSETKICSMWGDSYYRTFDGTFFVLLGNCNYTLVQTTCLGLNTSLTLQILLARAYLNGATVSSIHSVEMQIQGFNISMLKGEQNQIRVNGHGRYLPLTLGNGYLKIYQSGSGVVLDTSFGLTLQYDWVHNVQVEVGPELYGALCGLCGSANDNRSHDTISSNGLAPSKIMDFTLPWVLDSNAGSCLEDCGRGPCPVCSQSTRLFYPGIKGGSLENKCTLLKRADGPFSDCHSLIDPEPYVFSCVNNQCVSRLAGSVCTVFKAYANICQRLGGRIQDWRASTKCYLACPLNSHFEVCGSACQPTCVNPEAQHTCSLPCVESCQCNKGYLLSDGKCVSPSKCGCVYNDSYYPPTKTFWTNGECQEKCVCQPHSKTVMCTESQCQAGEVCRVIRGMPGCHADGPGLCVAKGDRHYTTFDGRKFDINGNCSYLLASHCPTWGDLQDFSIEVQNHIRPTANVSFRRVQMSVAGFSIEVSYEWSNKIKVDGLLVNLPSILSQGQVLLYLKGQTKCIETDFGVVVTYSSDILTITMPRGFSDNICGLCGNFNDNPEDDLMPDDTFDIVQAVRQWRTSNERECLDLPRNTSGCSQQEQALFQGKDFCGMLLDPEGAFQSCHKMVDPQDFYDNCVYGLCNGNRMTLCQILSSYVAVCQEVETLVDEWRESNFCLITCPPNSEYHLCSSHKSACVQNPSLLSERCKEGCYCKPGFFHSSGECVPESECGCSHNGVYYKIHENFHPDENCLKSCVCVGRNEVQCTNNTCPAETKCVNKHGRRACHTSQLKCVVMGGRHLQTFHGQPFDLNFGNSSYLLFQHCDDPGLSAGVQQGQLNLRIHGMNLTLTWKNLAKVKIDGVLMALPVHKNGVAVIFSGSLVRVICPDIGIVVIYGGPNLIQLAIQVTHKRLCGLCANAAAMATEEQGSLMTNHSITPLSLCLSPGANCNVDCYNCSQCNTTMEFASDSLCGMLLASEGSFGACHSTVDPMPFFQNCVNDLCRSNNDDLLCDNLRQYTFACQDAGAEVKPWRGDKCGLSCPQHSHYRICVSACSVSCGVLSDAPCPWPCYEGCQCDAGHAQSENGCVRNEKCGCFFRGQYHEVGEVVWNEGCSKRCSCCSTATLCCRPASCPKGQSCVLNQTWHCAEKTLSCPVNSHYKSCGTACPATCEAPFISSCNLACVAGCLCDPGFLLDGDTCVHPSQCGCNYDGRRYRSNETFWADDSCTRQCICDPNTHKVFCRVAYCGAEEYCDLQDGLRSCVNHDYQMCAYTGNHIRTFDQHNYDFHGTCQYQLFGICEQKQGLDVKVHVQTDEHLQSARMVLVTINGQLMKIDSKNTDTIKVNDIKRNMPFYPSNTALVFSLGLHTYIYTEGFGLSISKEGTVIIGLSSKYANATCGLCGNFNSDPADDLTVNGTQEQLNPEQFGKAWRSGQNHWCVEGCLARSCPNCSSEALDHFSDPGACGKILEVNGPFRDCHSKVDPSSFYKNCVSDLCLYGDVQPAVCRSLAEYADVCLYRKALVYAWRSPEFCYESCPSSTIYNMSTAPIHICVGWYNYTFELLPNLGENCICEAGLVHSGNGCVQPNNCGCLHNGEYFTPGEVVSTCDQRCLCHPGGNLTCVDVPCSEQEECKLIEGIRGCHPKAKMTHCSINGSQYTTFDGWVFEFQGSCNYTLVQTCSPKDLDVEPLFISVLGNNSERKQIYLHVNNMTFKMSTAYPGKIQVNGLYQNLTFSQNNVTVQQKNKLMTFKTANSVEIITDLHDHIEVKLPKNYRQTTCGLCGNYNGDPSDDMQLPNGTAVSNPDVFGSGWKLSDSESSCSDTCDSTCQRCLSPMSEYASDLYCGLVKKPKGPFSLCHPLIFPQKYYSLCMKYVCATDGQKQALCDALALYEAVCKVAGVSVDKWRNSTGCAPKCPQFSHYSQCANVCSSLCPGINLAMQCPRQCEEGCQCDDQHLYDGHACVPADQCGCMYNGRRFNISESQLLQNCTVNCTCGPPLDCEEHKCPPLHGCMDLDGNFICHKEEECEPFGGVKDCHPKAKMAHCSINGSQFTTFDGMAFEFHDSCNYTLVQTCSPKDNVEPLLISVHSNYSEGKKIHLRVNNVTFEMSTAYPGKIKVNGLYQSLTFSENNVTVQQKNKWTALKTAHSVEIITDLHNHIEVKLPIHYRQLTCGLCGNYNGDPSDDMQLPNGTAVSNPDVFGSGWKLSHSESSCNDTCDSTCQRCLSPVSEYASDLYCGLVNQPSGPFSLCHPQIFPQKYYSLCMKNLCAADGQKQALCGALEVYEAACNVAGVSVDPWRNRTGCAPKCPQFSHYSQCANVCSSLCPGTNLGRQCPRQCEEGCQCDTRHLYDGHACVPADQCGCMHDGRRIKVSESQLLQNCTVNCTCGPPLVCELHKCPPLHRCMVLNETASCHKEKEKCKLLGDIEGCHPKAKMTHCSINGSQYTTFDGLVFEFHGSCNYTLVQTCSPKGLGVETLLISVRGNHSESKQIYLHVNNMTFKMSTFYPGKIKVNGLYQNLTFSQNNVTVQQKNKWMTFKIAHSAEIITDLHNYIKVNLPNNYSQTTCGLCGNYNGDPSDDMQLPNGTAVSNPDVFGSGWKLSDSESSCSDTCDSTCQRCLSPMSEYASDLYCGLVNQPSGPFSLCHPQIFPQKYYLLCMKNLCAAGGQKQALCVALEVYEAVCKVAGVSVDQWRNSTGCALKCPQFSHYSQCANVCSSLCPGMSLAMQCPRQCEEGCQCDTRHLYDGRACVPADQCGCMHDGRRINVSESQLIQNCTINCTCGPPLVCEEHVCPALHSCKVLDGIAGCHKEEECKFGGGVESCHPKAKMTHCSINGSQYSTFDGRVFEFRGSCNYTLVQTCSANGLDVEPFLMSVRGNHSVGKEIYLHVNNMTFKMSTAFPGKILVNGLYQNLTFSQNNVTVQQKNKLMTFKTANYVEIITDLHYHIEVNLPNNYSQTACGLCGNYNGDPSDDLQLPNGTVVSNPDVFGSGWKLSDSESSCSDTCDSTCQRCLSPVSEYASDLYCGLVNQPSGPFSLCHPQIFPQKYYSLCMKNLCAADGQKQALCDALDLYEAACKVAGVSVDPWSNSTGCAPKCPQFSHYSQCANVCSSLCPGINLAMQCPRQCEEGCQCDDQHLYDGHACVPADQCGCMYNGRRFNISESQLLQNCTVNCTCGPPLVCEEHKCPPLHGCMVLDGNFICHKEEECEPFRGVKVCHPKAKMAHCSVNGSQYTTFDGLAFEFHNSCNYTLVQTCSPKNLIVEPLLISVRGNHSEGKRIHLQVNGLYQNLTFSENNVTVQQKNKLMTFKAAHSVEIISNLHNHIEVKLPKNYRQLTCGLCGNYNGDPSDDMQLPNGTAVSNPDVFGNGWKLSDSESSCSDTCDSTCQRCLSPVSEYASDLYCGLVNQPSGPFSLCHPQIFPQKYYSLCMKNLCAADGQKQALCDALEVYEAACKVAGVSVDPWRNSTGCAPKCPQFSHYSQYANVCSSLCPGMSLAMQCPRQCEEGCRCDTRHLYDGHACVPADQCGCMYNGKRIKVSESKLLQNCTVNCTCGPPLVCEEHRCPPLHSCMVLDGTVVCHKEEEECKFLRGVQGCHPKAKMAHCFVNGSQYTTFDGLAYEFHGSCNYTLVQTCSLKNLDVEPLLISVRGNHSEGKEIYLHVNNMTFKMSTSYPGKIQVNGLYQNLTFLQYNVTVQQKNKWTTFKTAHSVKIITDLHNHIEVKLPKNYHLTTCGLCGNYNGDPSDDMQLPNGSAVSNPDIFGSGWKLSDSESSCSDTCDSTCQRCLSPVSEYASDLYCGLVNQPNGPFSLCHPQIFPQKYYLLCMKNLCAADGKKQALCGALEEYEAACKVAGVRVDQWRNSTDCAQKCPQFSHYSPCANVCSSLCPGMSLALQCPRQCEEGCQCNTQHLYDGHACVPADQCGCTYDGRKIKVSESQLLQNCTVNCTCGPPLVCEEHKCPPLQSCMVLDGNFSCHKEEECEPFGGVKGCHSKAKMVHCSVNGSQYTTFDGRMFEFHGSCNYTLVQICSLKGPDVKPLLISVYGNHSEGKEIYLHVNNMTFKMSTAFPGKIQVNGLYQNLTISQNNVTVQQKNKWMTFKTAHSVEIITDLHNHIEVKLPKNYRQTTCGLCGNYNDDPSDDMQLPNGTDVSNPDVFGSGWKLSDSESSCSDMCDSTCQRCLSPVSEYASDLYCGLVNQPSGPFSLCHPQIFPQKYYSLCMKNLCAADGQKQALCDALEVYEAACKVTGVSVDQWRNHTGCAPKCPDFSHYSQCANVCSSLCPGISLAMQCSRQCEEGCQCDTRHLYDGHACVPADQCGCMQDGRRFNVSESQLLQNCTLNCTCGPPLVCEEHKCPPLHSCMALDGMDGCRKDEQALDDPSEGKCDPSEIYYLSNGEAVCESRPGRCWTWGSQHYRSFDGVNYDVDGTCTYLLSGSKGATCGAPSFSVSKKSNCKEESLVQLVTIKVYGFIIKLGHKDSIYVNGEVKYIPFTLFHGKIEMSNKDNKALLKTDFGLRVLFDWNTTVFITLKPHYKGIVYGLCGNFNDDPQDEYTVNGPGSPQFKTSVELAQAYRVFDDEQKCCSGCCIKKKLDVATLLEDVAYREPSSGKSSCADFVYPAGQYAPCHSLVNPDSFFQSCVSDLAFKGVKAAVDQTTSSYSLVCKELNEDFLFGVTAPIRCPPNSHYKTCGSACPTTCGLKNRICIKTCVKGCFCNPGFVMSPEGCVPPEECGCKDFRGKYHSLNSAFWIPDDCGQLCTCKPGEMNCSPSHCPKGMSCNKLLHKMVCQYDKPQNCSIVTGMHFTSFDGHRFDLRDSCAYIFVQTNANINGLVPFNITIADASCKKFFHSLTLKLSAYGLEVVIGKEDPRKLLIDGLHKHLPYYHHTGHVSAYRTPLSLVIHLDMGLQVIVYKTGTVVVVLPTSYASSVHGLCGNANSDPHDDQNMPDEEKAQNVLEFAHSWRLGGSMACRPSCTSRVKNCLADAQKLFEGSDFCGVLVDGLGPFAECALILDPKPYFYNCVADTCSYGGHNLALCSSIASYTAACQAAQLPVRQWRSDTFCGMTCPQNSHYELCGPRCPDVCAGLASATNCTGACVEGCQCDPGYILSDGDCVMAVDCGCLNDGQYHPAGYFYNGKICQICHCYEGKLSCSPSPCRPTKGLLSRVDMVYQRHWQYGVCEVFAGLGYVTFDGLFIPHYGACTYLISERSPKAIHGHTVLLSFEKDINNFIASKLAFMFNYMKVTINPKTPWIIQVNGEDFSVPYNSGVLQVYEDGNTLTVITVAGVRLELSSTKYLRLSIPPNFDSASGLCGNFNGDKSDDMELRTGNLTRGVAEFLHSWSVGQTCGETCKEDCGLCKLSSNATVMCDILLTTSIEFNHCLSKGVEAHLYRDVCLRAICGGLAYMEAVCLALEAYTATCQANGVTVGSWRKNTPCSYKCPRSSSPSQCVDSGSNSCPALLQPGSSATGCSGGCQCLNGNVFDGGECVAVGKCGCIVHGQYVKLEEQLYTENCTERCWCHPLGGALCEKASCSPWQMCALRNGSWGCHVKQEVCQLKDSLQVSTFTGQQLSLTPRTPYRLMGLCDEDAENWFSLISYNGLCDGSGTRLVTVFQILFLGFSLTIQDGIVKVNGHIVPLPHSLPTGVSLSHGVTQDKSEVVVILKRDFGLESELEMKFGVAMFSLKAASWYTGKLCGVCGNFNDTNSQTPLKSWILSDFQGCST